MLACAPPLPAPPEDEAALLEQRTQLILLLREVDARIRDARQRDVEASS